MNPVLKGRCEMDIRKNLLWRVPLYCVLAGIGALYLNTYVLMRFAIVTLSDGTVTSDPVKVLIIYGIDLAAALFIGRFFFRGMTKKELFLSATILVVIQMLITLIQWMLGGVTGPLGVALLYLSQISEWCRFVSQLTYRMTSNLWIGAFLEALMPYVFLLFGQNDVRTADDQ